MDEKEKVVPEPTGSPKPETPKEPQEIVVTLTEDGQVKLSWTIPSLIAALGMLEIAKQQIMAHSARQAMEKAMASQKIIRPKDNIFKNGLAKIIK